MMMLMAKKQKKNKLLMTVELILNIVTCTLYYEENVGNKHEEDNDENK